MSMSVAISTDSITVKSHYDRSRSSAGLSSGIDYPILRTQRFQFRPFVLADIALLVAIADEHRIADSTVGVPHPGTVEFARMCVSSHPTPWTSPRASRLRAAARTASACGPRPCLRRHAAGGPLAQADLQGGNA